MRPADHPSRVVVRTVLRRRVWSRNLDNEEALAHWAVAPETKKEILQCVVREICVAAGKVN